MDNKRIFIKKKNGYTYQFRIICTFQLNNKNYIIYNDHSILRVASIINNDIEQIDNKEEQELVKVEANKLLSMLNYGMVGV